MGQITIRVARGEDWRDIQRLNNEVFLNDKDHDDDLKLNWPFEEFGISYYHKLAVGNYGKCFVACDDQKIVGYIALAHKKFGYRKSKYIKVENIGVEPEYRSRGIGKLLMDTARNWAKVEGVDRLYVEAFWGNKRAIQFYKNCGFNEIGLELDMKL